MSAPKYEDFIRRELEDTTDLSKEERLELLKLLGKLQGKKLENARLRIKRGWGKGVGTDRSKKALKLPPLNTENVTETEKLPMMAQIDKILADMQAGGSNQKEAEEKQDDRKLDEPAGQERHSGEDGPSDEAGS
jgi:hypothetical protein